MGMSDAEIQNLIYSLNAEIFALQSSVKSLSSNKKKYETMIPLIDKAISLCSDAQGSAQTCSDNFSKSYNGVRGIGIKGLVGSASSSISGAIASLGKKQSLASEKMKKLVVKIEEKNIAIRRKMELIAYYRSLLSR